MVVILKKESLTSMSRLTTPVDLRLGFFLRWFEGWRPVIDGDEGVELVVETPVIPVEDVMVTEGTSVCSVKLRAVKYVRKIQYFKKTLVFN